MSSLRQPHSIGLESLSQHRKKACKACPEAPGDHNDKISEAYMQLQLELQRLYLGELLTIERLCIQLNILQRGNSHLRKLKEMHLKHIRPLIARLESPKTQVVRSELLWLMKMSRLLPPFLEEFTDSIQALRQRFQNNMNMLLNVRVTAAAA